MKRNTYQKKIVRDTLLGFQGKHPTADQVYEEVRRVVPTISRATVYRILNRLAEDGGVQRIQIPMSADRYDDCLKPHYHLRCSGCGRIFDVDMPVMENICDCLPLTEEYVVTGHDIVFRGICAACGANKIL